MIPVDTYRASCCDSYHFFTREKSIYNFVVVFFAVVSPPLPFSVVFLFCFFVWVAGGSQHVVVELESSSNVRFLHTRTEARTLKAIAGLGEAGLVCCS